MWTNQELETRIVILEAALAWVRHEACARADDPAQMERAMDRIAAIATQVLDDDERMMQRRRAHEARAAEVRAG